MHSCARSSSRCSRTSSCSSLQYSLKFVFIRIRICRIHIYELVYDQTAKNALRAYGITLRSITETKEFRVNYSGGSERTAYYTNDIDDAVNTGIAMADWKLNNK